MSGPAGRGGYAAGASWDEEQYRIARDRFRQLDAFANADLPLGPTTDLALTGRFADGTIDDYPDASGGPVYGSGLVRHTEHRDLALGARLGFGDPAGRRHQVSVALSRREQDRLSPAVPPVVPESDETHDVHAPAGRLAGAGGALGAHRRSTPASRARASGARTRAS